MQKLYYDATTGYLCNRYPKDIEQTDSSPYIEISDDNYEETLSCEYGKFWAVKDKTLVLIDDTETQATDDYKNFVKRNQIAEYQAYLSETDYVITKLSEAKIEDEEEYNTLLETYAEVLTKRKEARAKINELESA